MSTDLGMAKAYFKAQDFGKMLKLKEEGNLVITKAEINDLGNELEVTIITAMDNARNERVKLTKSGEQNIRRERYIEEFR